ncbi:hypothetical protein [Neorhodopirellula lusitana]|uniref:hypothetical protein n=1 Tax=Neorhodopirellula lusitana TaxID=445327 RepID=UPI00384FA41A
MRPSISKSLNRFALIWTGLLLMCAATGKIHPHLVSDTTSYLEYSFASAEDLCTQIRTPGYPAILRVGSSLFGDNERGLQAIVILQIGLHAIAVCLWYPELIQWGMTKRTAAIACIAFAVTNTFWDHVNTIATDAPAMSLSVIMVALVANTWRVGNRGNSRGRTCLIGGLTACVIAIRPAYLFLIPWLFLAMLVRPAESALVPQKKRFRDAIRIALIPVCVVLGWCAFRGSVVGEFGPLPFGHQNMAAVTTQLLDADELAALPGSSGELGYAIAQSRRDLYGIENRADATMTIDSRWDDMTYRVVIPAAEKTIPSGIVNQHQALTKLDRDIVLTYPLRYIKWCVLGFRRGVWGSFANIAMHPIYFPCLIGFAAWVIYRATQHSGPQTMDWSPLKPIVLIMISYAVMKIGFVTLTSPPVGRFSDAGMVFVPMGIAAFVMTLAGTQTAET